MMQPNIGKIHPRADVPPAEPIMKRSFFGNMVVAQGMMD